ncbi:hypothetical protein M514_07565, partial [Trichuris suis]
MSNAKDGSNIDKDEKGKKKKKIEASTQDGLRTPSEVDKSDEARTDSFHTDDKEKKHEEQYDTMPAVEPKKVPAVVKRVKRRRRKSRGRPLRRSKSLTDLPQSKKLKKAESSAIHAYSVSKIRRSKWGKRTKSQIDIITSGVKTIDLEIPPTDEEKNSWNVVRSTHSEQAKSCGTHRTEIALIVDNAFRSTLKASGERIKLEPVKIVGGWYKPIYRFYVNRLQDIGRLTRKRRSVSKFPTVRKLILEAVHLPPLASERREDELSEYVNVFIKAPLPAVATVPEKNSMLKELVKMVSIAFTTFSYLINSRDNFFKGIEDFKGKGRSVGRFLAELLVVLKNVLALSDSCTFEAGPNSMSLDRKSRRVSNELERIIQIVDLVQESSIFQGQEEKPTEQTGALPPGNYCQMVRLMDSFKRMRLYAASMLLRLPTHLENVEIPKDKALAHIPSSTTLQVPASWIQEVYTFGTKAQSTNAVAIQVSEPGAAKQKSTLREQYVNFDMSKWNTPREAVVYNPKLKVLFYVCEPANNLLSVQVRSANANKRRKLPEDEGAENAEGPGANQENENKPTSLATAGQDDDEGDGDDPPVATASPEESTDATLPFNKNQQSNTPTSDKSLTPKTGPSTPVLLPDGSDAKQSNQADLKNLSADLAKSLSRAMFKVDNADPADAACGPAATLQKRLGSKRDNIPYLELPSLPASDTPGSPRAPPMDVYKWAQTTTEKFATIKGCNPDRQRALCQAFFEEQAKLKRSLRLEQTPTGPPGQQKVELPESPSKTSKPNEWENLVNDWKRTSVERWNRYGIRLKLDDKKDHAEPEVKPQVIPKQDESLCSRILTVAYKTFFKDSDTQKKPADAASAGQKPAPKSPVGTEPKEAVGVREEEVKRFVNSLTLLTASQFPMNGEESRSKTGDAPASKQKGATQPDDQKPKKL